MEHETIATMAAAARAKAGLLRHAPRQYLVLSTLAGAYAQATVLRARLALPIDKRHARAEFQRARLASDAQAQLWATPQTRQGSGMLRGVAEADALIVLPEGAHAFSAGDVVDVLPLPGWPR